MKHMGRLIILMLIVSLLAACGEDDQDNENAANGNSVSSNYQGKKIVWIDSYHEGYAQSDQIQQGIEQVLEGTGVELKIIRLDTKRNTDAAFAEAAADKAKTEIDTFQPDVIIASDDNTQKYLIVPYYKDTATPVVFSGVNWDASPYGYPASNITGQVEIDLTQQLIELLKPYAAGDTRIAFLADDTESSQKNADAYIKYFVPDMQVKLVKTYAEFKQAYVDLQNEADILLVSNNASITDWDDADFRQFIAENTKIPTGSANDWMNVYNLITLAKTPSEFGEWSAQTALQILDGKAVADIPVASNQRGTLYVNLDVAKALDVAIQPNVLRNATIIGGGNGAAN
jgi:ABC-type uncharacterized transport system substrate-binding protein